MLISDRGKIQLEESIALGISPYKCGYMVLREVRPQLRSRLQLHTASTFIIAASLYAYPPFNLKTITLGACYRIVYVVIGPT